MMKRFMRLMTAAVLPLGMLLFGTVNAQAQTVDCSAHVLDATAQQGVDTNFISKEIDTLHKVAPGADVYVQAYDQLPGGNADAFWKQCANWRNETGDNAKDNLILVVYARDINRVNVYYGYAFDAAVAPYSYGLLNIANANLGGDSSLVTGDNQTSALVEPLISTPFYLKLSAHYSKKDGTFHLPSKTVNPGFQSADVNGLVKVALLVVLGAVVLFVVARPLERAVNRRIDHHTEQSRL